MAVTTARERLRDVRRWRRATVQAPSLAKRADAVYSVAIVVAIFGSMLYDTAHTALGDVLKSGGAETWGPAVLLLGIVAVARWGAYQGPVVYAVADVAHLLGAPLSRGGLARRRLLRAFAGGAAGGALVGSVAVLGLDGGHCGLTTARDVGLVGGVAAIGVLGVAAASGVQTSARAERVLGPVTVVALLAAAAGGVLGRDDASVLRAERWSGPWGWAIAPVSGASWTLALALLGVLALTSVLAALAWSGRCATERHVRRAEARAGAVASLVAFDARATRQALDRAGNGRAPRGSAMLARPPRRRELLLAWRGATALRRSPTRALEALVLSAGGTAVLLSAADRAATALLGGLLLYLGATRLLEPLRQEVDVPGRARILLPAAWGEMLFQHTFLPMALVGGVVLVASAATAASGGILPDGGALAACALVGAPVTVLAAALSARRGGRLPVSVLTTFTGADATGLGSVGVIGYVVLWPLVGAVAAGGPVALVAYGGAPDLPWALALGALALFGLASTLRTTERP